MLDTIQTNSAKPTNNSVDDIYNLSHARALDYMVAMEGVIPVSVKSLSTGCEDYIEAFQQLNRRAVAININKAREILGMDLVIFTGNAVQKTYSNTDPETRIPYTNKTRPVTGDVLFLEGDEEGDEWQDVYLTVTRIIQSNGITLPTYSIVIPSEEGKVQFVVPLAMWHYRRDASRNLPAFRLEAGRNWGASYTNAPAMNNFNDNIGLVLQTLLAMGFAIEENTSVSYETVVEHDDARRNGRKRGEALYQAKARETQSVQGLQVGARQSVRREMVDNTEGFTDPFSEEM